MAVYVDDAELPFGRMTMCHMIADSHEELLAMVDKIGVQRKWIQKAGTDREHFDICLAKRKLAVANGAQQITSSELVEKLRAKRVGSIEPGEKGLGRRVPGSDELGKKSNG